MKKSFFVLSFLIFLSVLAQAQNAKQLAIIEQNARPDVATILKDPDLTADFAVRFRDPNGKVKNISTYLPQFIVAFEKAYPGGTYAFLGRDMDLIADAVEAYYLSIGQKNRVRRIRFSTPSLTGATAELLTNFLVQEGLDLTPGVSLKPPFVIIDYTSYADHGRNNASFPSQARHIFKNVAKTMSAKGLSPSEIISRFSVATLCSKVKNGNSILDPLNTDHRALAESQAKSLATSGDLNRLILLNAGEDAMAYYSEWTGKFGSIRMSANGTLSTSPISTESFEDKKLVFSGIIQVTNIAKTPDFKARVAALARQHGVNFRPPVPPAPEPKKEYSNIRMDLMLKQTAEFLLTYMTPLSDNKDYEKIKVGNSTLKLTSNGQKVLQDFTTPGVLQDERYFEVALETLTKLYEDGKIGVRDFRNIFAYILGVKPITSESFITLVRSRYQRIMPLEILLGREEERQSLLSSGGIKEQNYRLLTDNGRLKLSCKYVFPK